MLGGPQTAAPRPAAPDSRIPGSRARIPRFPFPHSRSRVPPRHFWVLPAGIFPPPTQGESGGVAQTPSHGAAVAVGQSGGTRGRSPPDTCPGGWARPRAGFDHPGMGPDAPRPRCRCHRARNPRGQELRDPPLPGGPSEGAPSAPPAPGVTQWAAPPPGQNPQKCGLTASPFSDAGVGGGGGGGWGGQRGAPGPPGWGRGGLGVPGLAGAGFCPRSCLGAQDPAQPPGPPGVPSRLGRDVRP